MQFSQHQWLLESTFDKYLPVIAAEVAKIVIQEMESRFKMDYVSKKDVQKKDKEVNHEG
jgi:hypothetical protein